MVVAREDEDKDIVKASLRLPGDTIRYENDEALHQWMTDEPYLAQTL